MSDLPKWVENESIMLHEVEQQQSNAEIAKYIQNLKDKLNEIHTISVKLPKHEYQNTDTVFVTKEFFKWVEQIRDITRPYSTLSNKSCAGDSP